MPVTFDTGKLAPMAPPFRPYRLRLPAGPTVLPLKVRTFTLLSDQPANSRPLIMYAPRACDQLTPVLTVVGAPKLVPLKLRRTRLPSAPSRYRSPGRVP